jgi:hypothetical protein
MELRQSHTVKATQQIFDSGEHNAAPADTDRDVMPNEWETAHGLDPSNKNDGNETDLSAEGYTNLEMYLNELAGDPVKWAN